MNIIGTIIRYTKIIKSFWISSLSIELEYKLNFIVEIISVFGNLIGSIFVLYLFYSYNPNFAGWSWESSLVLLGIYSILEGFTISFLQPNLSKIVRHVQNGTLDFILLKPVDSQFWLSTRVFSPWGIPSWFLGILIISYGIIKSGIEVTLVKYILFTFLLLSGLLILYSLWFIIASTSIWFVKIWNANEVLRAILMAGKYPIYAFPPILRTIFTFLIPLAFLTTFPAEAILGTLNYSLLLISLFLSVFFFSLSRSFWKYAIKFYTSASS